ERRSAHGAQPASSAIRSRCLRRPASRRTEPRISVGEVGVDDGERRRNLERSRTEGAQISRAIVYGCHQRDLAADLGRGGEGYGAEQRELLGARLRHPARQSRPASARRRWLAWGTMLNDVRGAFIGPKKFSGTAVGPVFQKTLMFTGTWAVGLVCDECQNRKRIAFRLRRIDAFGAWQVLVP